MSLCVLMMNVSPAAMMSRPLLNTCTALGSVFSLWDRTQGSEVTQAQYDTWFNPPVNHTAVLLRNSRYNQRACATNLLSTSSLYSQVCKNQRRFECILTNVNISHWPLSSRDQQMCLWLAINTANTQRTQKSLTLFTEINNEGRQSNF